MRKLRLIFAAILLLSGCSRQAAVLTPTPTPVKEEEPPPASEFYKTYAGEDSRPIAVMIDNDDKNALPHSGIKDAYMVYEMYVEGRATRFMALFKNTQAERIGPVRSSRHYFLDYALEHDAIYVHYGWSPKAITDIKALGVNNINGVQGADGNVFWRERKYKNDWHSAYTSTDKILARAVEKGYRTESAAAPLQMNPRDVDPNWPALTSLALPYAGFYKVSFEYDEESASYLRYLNGSPHVLYDGAHLAAKNIIIMRVRVRSLGDGTDRQDIETVGRGEGYFLTMGKYLPITWEKPSRTGRTVYKNAAGEEIILNPGQTWVELITPEMDIGISPAD